jgi:hypothetical protein
VQDSIKAASDDAVQKVEKIRAYGKCAASVMVYNCHKIKFRDNPTDKVFVNSTFEGN